MSSASTQSRGYNKRADSLRSDHSFSRDGSRPRKRIISPNDAYLYALRVGFLAYVLRPRAKRSQPVLALSAPAQRSSMSVNDLMKDFSLLRENKSTRLPHGFVPELEKRLRGVLMGSERKPEYNDAAIKRSFAVFFNAFSEPGFKRRVEKDRRVEDLVLIFYSNATKELSKGKAALDDTWKLMVDRHLALFVRLVGLILKDHDWARERPELSSRLATLESKLLAHDQDLAAPEQNGASATTIEVEIPRSYEVKDMPLVQIVGQIFGLRNSQMQSDINKYKSTWTEKAALQDLKTYQNHLNLQTHKTLNSDDWDLDEPYEQWKKHEMHDLSQMMMAIIQSNPDLAKAVSSSIPQFKIQSNHHTSSEPQYHDILRRSDSAEASYVVDQPVDMSQLKLDEDGSDGQSDDDLFTFIPPDPRGYYRFILAQAFTFDMHSKDADSSDVQKDTIPIRLLSSQTNQLLNELSLRWRLPFISRKVLFLDMIREKFVEQEVTLDTLDAAFTFSREHVNDKEKSSEYINGVIADRDKWPMVDIALNQQIITTLHVALLRDLFDLLQHCYEPKSPSVGPIVYVLENYIYADPSFSQSDAEMISYRNQLYQGLTEKAHDLYKKFLEEHVPNDQNSWDFVHVIELGKAVVALAQRTQKRYRKKPEILG